MWVIAIETFNLGVLFYASRRLSKGLPHTLAQRNETLQKSRVFITSMAIFWIGPAVLATTDYYDGSSVNKRRHTDLGVAISLLLSLRGAWSVGTIILINRKDFTRSRGEQVLKQVAEEQSFSPHLNTALRTEILFYATLCVRAAVQNHEVMGRTGLKGLSSDFDESAQGTEMSDFQKRRTFDMPLGHFTDNDTYVYEVKSLGQEELTTHPIGKQILAEQEERTQSERHTMRHTFVADMGIDDGELEGLVADLESAQRTDDNANEVHNSLHDLEAPADGASKADADADAARASAADGSRQSGANMPGRRAPTELLERIGSMREVKEKTTGQDCLSSFFPDTDVLRFRDYCPAEFVEIRGHISKIDPLEYMASWTTTTNESFSEGASGAFIFFSKDGKYIVKTCTRGEMDTLLQMLPSYVEHLRSNPNSRLLTILGAHCMEIYGQKIDFLVMNNIFPTDVELDERYDLKGSWVNRQSGGKDRPRGRLLKDMDLNYVFMTREDVGYRLALQIKKDIDFLTSHNLMDYSLLVGVKYERYAVDIEEPENSETDPFLCDGTGGMNAAVVAGPAVFYVGIIDILQTWNYSKQMERWAKFLFKCQDRNGISAVPTLEYRDRFFERAVKENFEGAHCDLPHLKDIDEPLRQSSMASSKRSLETSSRRATLKVMSPNMRSSSYRDSTS